MNSSSRRSKFTWLGGDLVSSGPSFLVLVLTLLIIFNSVPSDYWLWAVPLAIGAPVVSESLIKFLLTRDFVNHKYYVLFSLCCWILTFAMSAYVIFR